ncbi:transposase InsO family protein [Variovorax boronicumulans]|uniref:IS3 family transposase n=1 Tax=Variovorax boronicumulans TaxID=436515 RepID=UPI00278ABF6B|nr:IS3 family transposase [Variovorax boronicumulans]MDQ0082449.1 transposase InsO family protein [Variovorax boronicumulans]
MCHCTSRINESYRFRHSTHEAKGRIKTREQIRNTMDSYIRWYNEQRIKISLGSLSPIEYRESLGLTA